VPRAAAYEHATVIWQVAATFTWREETPNGKNRSEQADRRFQHSTPSNSVVVKTSCNKTKTETKTSK